MSQIPPEGCSDGASLPASTIQSVEICADNQDIQAEAKQSPGSFSCLFRKCLFFFNEYILYWHERALWSCCFSSSVLNSYPRQPPGTKRLPNPESRRLSSRPIAPPPLHPCLLRRHRWLGCKRLSSRPKAPSPLHPCLLRRPRWLGCPILWQVLSQSVCFLICFLFSSFFFSFLFIFIYFNYYISCFLAMSFSAFLILQFF